MSAAPRPKVTIGIPLYAAAPWVERIVANIRALAAPDVEFLLSDRHRLDDAAERVRARCAAFATLRIDTCDDRRGWIDNYNHLLDAARGDYLRILTQDDLLPQASLAAAVAALDADPEAALAVGPADLVDAAGRPLLDGVREPSLHAGEAERTRDALRLFGGSRYREANLALIRRRVAVEHGLRIPPTYGDSGLSVRAWLFALALRGRIAYVPDYASQRCVHPDSYTARHWRRSPWAQGRRAWSYFRAGARFWNAVAHGARRRVLGLVALGYAALLAMPSRQLSARASARHRRVAAAQGRRDDGA